jgi:hypothetical protein
VLHYTALYRILGLDWSFDRAHPVWQEYIHELQQEEKRAERTYQFYLQRYCDIPKFSDEPHWGCFAYEFETETHSIHLQFSNEDTSEYSALSHLRIGARREELKEMFSHIKQA